MEELVQMIISGFSPGDLITHSFLKQQFKLPELNIEDFASTEEFIIELQNSQFSYMGMVDKLRDDLLYTHRYYLKNVRGDGYTILQPKEQVTYAYNEGMADIKKAIKQAKSIMMNIRFEDIPADQMAKDNDLLSKMSSLAQMFANKRN